MFGSSCRKIHFFEDGVGGLNRVWCRGNRPTHDQIIGSATNRVAGCSDLGLIVAAGFSAAMGLGRPDTRNHNGHFTPEHLSERRDMVSGSDDAIHASNFSGARKRHHPFSHRTRQADAS